MMAMSAAGAVKKALETPELLEAVLSFVPPDDLKNARAVAKLWRDESLDSFRSSLIYVVDPETEAKRMLQLTVGMNSNGGFCYGQKSLTALPLSTTLYAFGDKPLKKYRLMEPLEFPPPVNVINSVCVDYCKMHYFWERCAPHLTYLDLKGASYFHVSSFIDGLIWLLNACPNLEELGFDPIWYSNTFVRAEKNGYDTLMVYNELFSDYFGILNLPRVSEEDLAKMCDNVALKVKSLSIGMTGCVPDCITSIHITSFDSNDSIEAQYLDLWRCVLSLMPNLKRLSMDGNYYFVVMNALLQKTLTTNQFIQLESFEYMRKKTLPFEKHFRLIPLMKYLESSKEITDTACLKNLKLMNIPFYTLWMFPRSFRNVLFCIQKRIERLCIGLTFLRGWNNEPPQHYKFDFFNFIFPELTELTLEFDHGSHSQQSRYYLFFDFSVFRGTPNLTRVRIETSANIPKRFCPGRSAPHMVWLRRRLTPQNLLFGEDGEKWYETECVREGDEEVGMNILEGDGSETFDPEEEENEIVLEKMKEFYFTSRFTIGALLLLGKWMKNLKEIAVIFDDDNISIPFIVWPGTLRKVTVLRASFDGEGINSDLISSLREMYPEIEIMEQDQIFR